MQVMAKARDLKSFDLMEERIRENLVKFLADSGYSQNQLADLSGIAQANLGRYLRGENAVPASALAPLSQVFGCSVADFYSPAPPSIDPESAPPYFLKSRPGVEITEEDEKDWQAFLERVQGRRVKKAKRR